MQTIDKNINALTKIYDLLLWIIPILEKFPRSQKFLLADRIETGFLDIQDLIIQAVYSKGKVELLTKVNLKLEQLRYLVRLSMDLKYLTFKRYTFLSEKIDGIGKEIGGWLKFCKNRTKT
ncbi:MAG: diversity-generating retroelement protein Avd [Desulfobacterales bacterium]|nr:diversity-generating retroelement protein Avd [Desulfobacterales bacterium]